MQGYEIWTGIHLQWTGTLIKQIHRGQQFPLGMPLSFSKSTHTGWVFMLLEISLIEAILFERDFFLTRMYCFYLQSFQIKIILKDVLVFELFKTSVYEVPRPAVTRFWTPLSLPLLYPWTYRNWCRRGFIKSLINDEWMSTWTLLAYPWSQIYVNTASKYVHICGLLHSIFHKTFFGMFIWIL